MDMVIPGNLNFDQNDNAWAQSMVTALASGATDNGAHRLSPSDDMITLDSHAYIDSCIFALDSFNYTLCT